MAELRYPDRNRAAELGGAPGLLELVYNPRSGGLRDSSQTWKESLAAEKRRFRLIMANGAEQLWAIRISRPETPPQYCCRLDRAQTQRSNVPSADQVPHYRFRLP